MLCFEGGSVSDEEFSVDGDSLSEEDDSCCCSGSDSPFDGNSFSGDAVSSERGCEGKDCSVEEKTLSDGAESTPSADDKSGERIERVDSSPFSNTDSDGYKLESDTAFERSSEESPATESNSIEDPETDIESPFLLPVSVGSKDA